MASRRKQKKARHTSFECAHIHHSYDYETYDPYDSYYGTDWCGLNYFGLGNKESPDIDNEFWGGKHPCELCKSYCANKAGRLKTKDIDNEMKAETEFQNRLYKKYGKYTLDELKNFPIINEDVAILIEQLELEDSINNSLDLFGSLKLFEN